MQDSEVSQKKVIERGFSTQNQKLQFFSIVRDLGYMQRNVGISDQWACAFAEDIVRYV
jgi:hypothetical protein